jgi:hypothetical protein
MEGEADPSTAAASSSPVEASPVRLLVLLLLLVLLVLLVVLLLDAAPGCCTCRTVATAKFQCSNKQSGIKSIVKSMC